MLSHCVPEYLPAGDPRGTWPFTAPEAAWPCGRPWDLAKADVSWQDLYTVIVNV